MTSAISSVPTPIVDEYEAYVSMHQTDAAAVLYAVAPSQYAQVGMENLFRRAGHPLETLVGRDLHYPVVNYTIDHAKPLRLGQKLLVRTFVSRVGNRSYTVETHVIGPDGDISVTIKMTGVAVHGSGGAPRVEDWIRELVVDDQQRGECAAPNTLNPESK